MIAREQAIEKIKQVLGLRYKPAYNNLIIETDARFILDSLEQLSSVPDLKVLELKVNPHWQRYAVHQAVPKTFEIDGVIWGWTSAAHHYAEGYKVGAEGQRDYDLQQLNGLRYQQGGEGTTSEALDGKEGHCRR